MDYKVIQEENTPIQVRDWVKANRSKEKHSVIETNSKIYIVVTRGEKRTSGYEIIVKNIDVKETEIHITFQYKDPKPDSLVMQVLAYPLLILEIEKTDKTIVFHILR
ncbi:protease complex subunit PrcB family protein [Tepidibacillus fermentans]|uniref:Protease stability complex PrcB-like protein n=1 Tax=Tepidibacillus fermentans TaxID=1281767 RepID=A0A4R3KK05_9BACI|nr:protease complex subunit PrcB family protein [Tepidibacillus fermentans]TCS83042.1 protease stability complex PrcB-like protein [Tepidibacillus fermentans]